MTVKLITDSACDLPAKLAARYEIEVIPTPLIIEGRDYFDGETIESKEFYHMLREGKEISTYHINTYMFTEHFRPYAKRGDSLIYICFSTGIAGTFNAARQAKELLLEEYPDFDLTIIDSKCASIGFGIVVLYAGMMRAKGAGKEELIQSIQYHCSHMNHVFTVDTLSYLLKGGRISKTSAIAGGILDIKPIIIVDESGVLSAVEKVRGRKKSIQRLAELVGRKGSGLKDQIIGVVHGDDEGMLKKTTQMLKDTYGVSHIVENYVGDEEITGKTDVELARYRNKKIGYILQGQSMLNNLSVIDNVCLPAYLSKDKSPVRAKAVELLEVMGLENLKQEYPGNLSGGELRRAAIARAMINNPAVILADEPTSNLDPENSVKVMELLRKVNKQGTTVLVSTHELEYLEYTDCVYKMHKGKLSKGITEDK